MALIIKFLVFVQLILNLKRDPLNVHTCNFVYIDRNLHCKLNQSVSYSGDRLLSGLNVLTVRTASPSSIKPNVSISSDMFPDLESVVMLGKCVEVSIDKRTNFILHCDEVSC